MKTHPRHSKLKRGFSLTEVLTTVGLLSVLTTIGLVAMNKHYETAGDTKLRQQVKSLNAAIQTYEISGGSLEGTTTANAVIT